MAVGAEPDTAAAAYGGKRQMADSPPLNGFFDFCELSRSEPVGPFPNATCLRSGFLIQHWTKETLVETGHFLTTPGEGESGIHRLKRQDPPGPANPYPPPIVPF